VSTGKVSATCVSTARFGVDPERVALHVGDAVTVLGALTERPDLVYADPPFATGRRFDLSVDVELDGERTRIQRAAFDDRLADLDAFTAFIDGFVVAAREAVADDGSLLLHLDHRFAHRAAVCCDERFGPGDRVPGRTGPGFRNELIWTYGLGGSSRRYWPRKHDTILWYTRSAEWFFEPPMVPATSQRLRGRMKKRPDVLDVPTLNNMSRERVGWPTQKPVELLELLVGAHTRADALVCDPFCGSGTTAVAAAGLGRRVIASDVSADAVGFTLCRLLRAGRGAVVRGIEWRPDAPAGAPLTMASVGRITADGYVADRTWVAPARDGDGVWRGPTPTPQLAPPRPGDAWRARTLDGRHLGADSLQVNNVPWVAAVAG